MSTVGGETWSTAGDLPVNGTSDLTPITPADGPSTPYHSAYWKWTAPSDGMMTVDNFLSPFTSAPDTLMDVFSGPESSPVLVVEADDTEDPVSGTTQMTRVGFFAEAGVEYHIRCGTFDTTTGLPDGYVLRTVWWPAGPGVPGPDWDHAGDMPIGYRSRLMPPTAAGEAWFTITSDHDTCLNLDVMVVADSDGSISRADTNATVYSAPAVEVDFERSTERVFKVAAGVTYRALVSVADQMSYIELTEPTADPTWLRDADFVITNNLPSSGADPDILTGDAFNRTHTTTNNPDSSEPDYTALKAFANSEWAAMPAPTVAGGGAGAAGSTGHISAKRDTAGLAGVEYTEYAATSEWRGVGFEVFGSATAPITFTVDDADLPVGVLAAEREESTSAWQQITLEFERVYTEANENSSGGAHSDIYGYVDFYIGPDANGGVGDRIADTFIMDGAPAYQIDTLDIPLTDADWDIAGHCWLFASQIQKTADWVPAHAAGTTIDTEHETVSCSPGVFWQGGGGTGLRLDTFKPPRYRWLYAVEALDLPTLTYTPLRRFPPVNNGGFGPTRHYPRSPNMRVGGSY